MMLKLIKYPMFLFCFLSAVFYPAYSMGFWGSDPISDDSKDKIESGLLDKDIAITPQLNKLNVGFGRYGDLNCYFIKTVSRIFFQDKPIQAKVTEIAFDDREITVELGNPILGPGTVKFIFQEDSLKGAGAKAIEDLLLTCLSNENDNYVFCNLKEKTYHLFTSNHLPEGSNCKRMTLAEAQAQGYKKCGFCFRKVLYLPELLTERLLEKESSARLRYYQPLSHAEEKQAHLKAVGERILNNWPFKLMGYDYSFQLVQGPKINAFSIPSGKVFITSGLYNSLENEEELEGVLAHEIAHTENRHSLKQYYKAVGAVQTQQGMALASAILLAGAGSATTSPALLSQMARVMATIGSVATQLQLFGYLKDYEREADEMAMLYFDINGKDKKHLINIFRKLQFSTLCKELKPEVTSMTHPYLSERIERVKKTKIDYSQPSPSFLMKREDKCPVQLDILCQFIWKNRQKVLLYITDKSLLHVYDLSAGQKDISLMIEDNKGRHVFKYDRMFTTEDSWGARVTFQKDFEEGKPYFSDDIDNVLLSVSVLPDQGTTGMYPEEENFKFFPGKIDL